MAIASARVALSRIFFQRCFYLFVVLVVLLILTPLIPESDEGRFIANLINAFVVIATVAAVGRTLFSFILVLLLAAPTLLLQWLGLSTDEAQWLAYSWMFGALLYLTTIIYLLQYVFRPNVMTTDKLFGAAAGYLMLGVFWAYLYRLIGYYNPAAFAVAGQATSLESFDALYFSMTVLTSTGFGDITPLTKEARAMNDRSLLFVALLAASVVSTPHWHGRRPMSRSDHRRRLSKWCPTHALATYGLRGIGDGTATSMFGPKAIGNANTTVAHGCPTSGCNVETGGISSAAIGVDARGILKAPCVNSVTELRH